MAYSKKEMVFLETKAFTKRITNLLEDTDYARLQQFLAEHPESGDLIRGSGGLRKIRWALKGSGKSGGIRTIYYWAKAFDQILMVFVFTKNEADNLTDQQTQILRAIVEEQYP